MESGPSLARLTPAIKYMSHGSHCGHTTSFYGSPPSQPHVDLLRPPPSSSSSTCCQTSCDGPLPPRAPQPHVDLSLAFPTTGLLKHMSASCVPYHRSPQPLVDLLRPLPPPQPNVDLLRHCIAQPHVGFLCHCIAQPYHCWPLASLHRPTTCWPLASEHHPTTCNLGSRVTTLSLNHMLASCVTTSLNHMSRGSTPRPTTCFPANTRTSNACSTRRQPHVRRLTN